MYDFGDIVKYQGVTYFVLAHYKYVVHVRNKETGLPSFLDFWELTTFGELVGVES